MCLCVEQESDYGGGEDEGGDSDHGRKSRKRGSAKHTPVSTPQPATSTQQDSSGQYHSQ